MIERFQISLRNSLALLLQMEPNQQIWSMVVVFLFIILINAASNALYEALNLSIWVTPLVLLVVVFGMVFYGSHRLPQTLQPAPPFTGPQPQPHAGLVIFLSLFNSRGDQQSDELRDRDWRRKDLQKAIDDPNIGWPHIIDRFTHSNMRPAIEAIRHHMKDKTLRHVWLISTADLVSPDGEAIQEGSHHLAPLFARVIKDGFRWDVTFHHVDPQLCVQPYELRDSYQAVEYVFSQAVQQVNLHPEHIIADPTSGRVPMSGGMILACAPRNWTMQYTTTDRDPAQQGPGDTPIPLTLHVDAKDLWLCALQAVQTSVSSLSDTD